MPNREGNFDDKAYKFQDHAKALAGTAQHVASAGGCNNKKTIEGINTAAHLVCTQAEADLVYYVQFHICTMCRCMLRNYYVHWHTWYVPCAVAHMICTMNTVL